MQQTMQNQAQRCPVCQGRTVRTEAGFRCLNSSCKGSKPGDTIDTLTCECGEQMEYGSLDSWGQPTYYCTNCGAKQKR